MSRLPTPGGDLGNWGTILNDFLRVSHNEDGTLKAKPVNVKDFGAKGDGTTNDTAAIQAALTQATTNKRALYLPAGVYIISQEIATAGGMLLYGDGIGGTTIKAAPGSNVPIMLRIFGQFSQIRELLLDGNDTALVGLSLHNAARSLIESVAVKRTQQYGFSLHNYAVPNVKGNNNSAALIKCVATANNGIGFGTPALEPDNNAVSFFSCTANLNKSHGLFFRGMGLTIFGGHFEGNEGYAIKIGDAADSGWSQGITIYQPWLEANALGGVIFSKGSRCSYYYTGVGNMQSVDWANSHPNGQNFMMRANTDGYHITHNGRDLTLSVGGIAFGNEGTIFVENGALKYKGKNGTVTTVAPA